jgi:hypothetical protein
MSLRDRRAHDPNGAIPPEAIKGAWQVDKAGSIVGEFIPNPNFVPDHPLKSDHTAPQE